MQKYERKNEILRFCWLILVEKIIFYQKYFVESEKSSNFAR